MALLTLSVNGKGMLILQCGSDWCDSGEYVRRVFTSPEFRTVLGGRFDLAVYDDMENPTPKVKAANEKLKDLRVASMRFPAITCLTDKPYRLFAQLENVPFDVTPQSLAEMVQIAGPCELRGIVIVNRDADKAHRDLQVPFEVEISDDNAQWQKVFDSDKLMETYRFEFKSNKRPRARYVRVRRLREMDGKRESKDDFRLSKILVYGRKLYQ